MLLHRPERALYLFIWFQWISIQALLIQYFHLKWSCPNVKAVMIALLHLHVNRVQSYLMRK